MTFDAREVLMPVVPLGVVSYATVHIVNHGYDNLELQYKLPADEDKVPLKVRRTALAVGVAGNPTAGAGPRLEGGSRAERGRLRGLVERGTLARRAGAAVMVYQMVYPAAVVGRR